MAKFKLFPEATQIAVTDAQPVVTSQEPSAQPTAPAQPQPPVLITEHEVMLGTAAAVRPRPTLIGRRMVDALRDVAGWRPPPPRPFYARRAHYLEHAAMSREMDRL